MNETSAHGQQEALTTDQVIALLGIYTGQAASYTTLLWQVPALSLTAQSFLLTIALSGGNSPAARITSAALSMVISASSYALMHDQRGHAINHGELAMRLSQQLPLRRLIDIKLHVSDGIPRTTDADHIWTWHHEGQPLTRRAGWMYAVWKGCMILFLLVDIGIIYLAMTSATSRAIFAASLVLLSLIALAATLIRKGSATR